MNQNQWQRIETIYHSALEIAEEDRAAYLDEVCSGDSELRDEVASLLSEAEQQDTFLSEPTVTLGLSLLVGSETESLIGQQVGSYRIIKLLGRGGMGEVYLAEDPRLERLVALKLLPSFLTHDQQSVQRFQQEARAASGVSHPHIAHVYEIGEAKGRHYIAMEHVEGSSLRVLLSLQSMSLSEAVEVCLQTAQALIAAHAAGVVHRDIKPENIMVRKDGYAKVLDFGLAKLTAVKGQTPHRWKSFSSLESTPGLIMGTTAYMSPEQVRGQEADVRTDLWSLGVVLYEMLTGQRPFSGKTSSDVSAAILLSEPSPLPEDEAATLGLTKIIRKALVKEADGRYQTASEFARELQRVKQRLQIQEHNSSIEASLLPLSGTELPGESRSSHASPGADNISRGKWREFSRLHWSIRAGIAAAIALPLFFLAATFIKRVNTPTQTLQNSARMPAGINSSIVGSMVILPFVNDTGEAELDYLAVGLTEDLTRNLSRSPSRLVIAGYSARRTVELGFTPSQMSARLGVEAALHGRIQRQGTKLSIRLWLANLKTNEPIWEDALTADPDELLHLRDLLTAMLTTEMQGLTGEGKTLPREDRLTNSNEAYHDYLEGKYITATGDVKSLRRSVNLLEKAIALDPQFALAHVALANSYNLLSTFLGQSPEHYQPKARQEILRALALDDTLAEAHTSLAKIKMDDERDWDGAEREFRRALEINPNDELAHHWYGEVYLSAMGRLQDSLAELQIAHRLNPLSTGILTGLAWTYIGLHQYEQAVEQCRRAQEINPGDWGVYSYRAMALMKLGRFQESINDARVALERDPRGSNLAMLGAIYAASGRRDEALQTLEELRRNASFHGVSKYDLAIVYAALDDKDTAFRFLDEELGTKSVALFSIRIDPMLDSLRHDPRFSRLEERLGFGS